MKAPLVVGNWKMYGNQAGCQALARAIVRGLKNQTGRAEVAIAPPFTALAAVKKGCADGLMRN